MKSKRIFTIALFSLLIISLTSCNKEIDEPVNQPADIELTAKSAQIINNSNNFGIDLFSRVAAVEDESKNLMISPLSASIALTMAYNGADGKTASQMKSVLGYADDLTSEEINESYLNLLDQLLNADESVKLSIANALFYKLGFSIKSPFLNTLTTSFDADVDGLNFSNPSSVDVINQWASDNTNGKIEKVIEEISPDAAMFLMNALYFKGSWTTMFDKNSTTDMPFYLSDGSQVNAPFMNGEINVLGYEDEKVRVLEIPYGRKNFSMVIALPQEDLQSYLQQFTPEHWSTITSQLDSEQDWYSTNVMMPKFSFDYEKYFNDQLIAMGMTDAFSPFHADFSAISDTSIFISFVKQNTFIDVNEEGTEAAAVTTIGFEFTSAGPQSFMINKPFVFAIRERTTNTLMFLGKVENPL
jgi:serpin B